MEETIDLVRARHPWGSADICWGSRTYNPPSVVIPALILGSINAWNLWNEHWEHWEHMPPLEERPAYPYLNIRTKNFCWGDGDKVSQFFRYTLLYR